MDDFPSAGDPASMLAMIILSLMTTPEILVETEL
jgi:hypothetical protein